MPISETVPDMFEVQLKAGSADNPIWEVINTRTKEKFQRKVLEQKMMPKYLLMQKLN